MVDRDVLVKRMLYELGLSGLHAEDLWDSGIPTTTLMILVNRGDHFNVTLDGLVAFADFFGCSVDYLLGRTEIRKVAGGDRK